LEEKKEMSYGTTHEFIVKNSKKIAHASEKRSITAAAEEYGISNWSVYVARAIEGAYVPKATLDLIKKRTPSMRTSRKGGR
jgi:hypothetical protein